MADSKSAAQPTTAVPAPASGATAAAVPAAATQTDTKTPAVAAAPTASAAPADSKASVAADAKAAAAAAGAGSDEPDLDALDGPALMELISALPRTTRGMSPADAATHMKRVDALLSAFEKRQDEARAQLYAAQQQKREFLAYLKQHYKPLHPELYELKGWKFVPSFVAAANAKTPTGAPDAKAHAKILTEVSPTTAAGAAAPASSSSVYVFDMVSGETCAALCAEVRHFEQWMSANQQRITRPNTMNKYGVILDDIGFAPALRELMRTYVAPFATHLYGDTGGSSLDAHHGFVVEYEMGKDRKLDLHVDDADVTLNLSLGEQFEGGGLEFAGARCPYHQGSEPQRHEVFRVEHACGQAYLHRGKHRHAATPITDGHRLNLILWCISTGYRDSEQEQPTCRDWCGYRAVAKLRGEKLPPSESALDHAADGVCGGSGSGAGHNHSHSHGAHGHSHGHGHDDDDDDDDHDGHSHSHGGHGHSHGGVPCGGHGGLSAAAAPSGSLNIPATAAESAAATAPPK